MSGLWVPLEGCRLGHVVPGSEGWFGGYCVVRSVVVWWCFFIRVIESYLWT